MINDVYEAICSVSLSNTDFYLGFDSLFEFMCDHPESETTRGFIQYHVSDMGDPRLENGKPEFTYLIGRRFILEEWVDKEDRYRFNEYMNI